MASKTEVAVERRNLSPAALYEHAIRRGEAAIVSTGALTAETGKHTGRSPQDKFFVKEPTSQDAIWWHPGNKPIAGEKFDGLTRRMQEFVDAHEVYTQDVFACADPRYRLRVRVISELAWHSLFARNLFIRPNADELMGFESDFTVISLPSFKADPARDGTHSETFILVNLGRRMVLIGGTGYAGEIKKSIFTALNYLLPAQSVFPMHCSANTDIDGSDVALFFGLSGTGKTTLSADPHRRLIGDDEHGWSDRGVFNFEGGCYAKCIRLSAQGEPQIWNAIRYGTVLENVVIDPETGEPDFDSAALTENTRAAYPLAFIENAVIPSVGGQPSHVIFLTADAFGVLPPISRLTPEQAMYHFLSGYTAKVAGTERVLGKDPEATCSVCFGAPFLPRHPNEYAAMLGEKMRRHQAHCWLVNTGWVGGPFGVGERMKLKYTRSMLNAILSGALNGATFSPHPVFRVLVPASSPYVPSELLDA